MPTLPTTTRRRTPRPLAAVAALAVCAPAGSLAAQARLVDVRDASIVGPVPPPVVGLRLDGGAPQADASSAGLAVQGVTPVAGRRTIPAVGRVRVRGVVYDSLLGAPLAGATVLREGEAAVAFTDSAGRFVLDSVPAAPGRFVYSHPGLDSVGLSDVPAAVDLSTARDSVVVRLATPSRTTLAARICGAGAPRGGLAFGEVRDAVAGARLAGARTAVAWTVIDTTVRPFAVRNARRDAVADSSGAWSACGLPIGDALEARAAAGTAESGRAAFALGPRGVARIDLWVALAGETAAATAPTGAPPAGTPPATAPAGAAATEGAPRPAPVGPGVLVGMVRDSTGAGRGGAVVVLDGLADREARTDADGRFRLTGLPLGTATAVVRAVGYAPQSVPVAVRAAEPAEIDVTLRRVVTLAGVEVRAKVNRTDALTAEIAHRQRLGVSQLVDTALARRTGTMRSALGAMPFVTVATARGAASDWFVQFTRRGTPCTARVFVDGVETVWQVAQDLSPAIVTATEVFRDPNRIPPQYGGTSMTTECGAVFFWTRSAR